MEYAKDEIFNIRYDKRTNTLETKREKKNRTGRLLLRRNSMVKVITGLTILLSVTNFVLIYHFFTIMSTI